MRSDHKSYRPRRRRGFSLVEVMVSTVILGVLLVAALNTVGAATRARRVQVALRQGTLLARHLMAEVLQARYEEPDETPIFGRESGESAGARGNWDDLDDYHGWSVSPPQSSDGTSLPNSDGWQREVTVEYVNPNNPQAAVGNDTGVKRIIVTVTDPTGDQTTLVALRSNVGAYDQVPAVETTFVTWIGVELQIGSDTASRVPSAAFVLNQLQTQ